MSSNDYPFYLATAATASGNYPTTPGYIIWPGGSGTVQVDGTYNGANVVIQAAAPNSSNFVALEGATFDASNLEPGTITLGERMKVRAVISAAGGSTSLNIGIFIIPR